MDMRSWRAADARDLYNVPVWGEGYFDVSDEGHVLVRPNRDPAGPAVDLFEIASTPSPAPSRR
jgi:arginine decarboxylase